MKAAQTSTQKAPEELEKLRVNEERFKVLVENLTDLIYILDFKTGHYLYISPYVKQIFGYTVEEALKLSPQDVMTSESYKRQFDKLKLDLQKFPNVEKEATMELELIRKDGSNFWGEINARFLTSNKGQPTSILGVIRDITEHKIIEAKMEASEERYRRLFETAQDGVFLIDFKTGMILDVNPFLIKMLGYSKKDFLKKYLWQVGVFKDIAASKENFRTLQTKRYVRFEDLPLQTKDGKRKNVEFVANAYSVGDSTIIQCNVRDITDRRIIENKIKESEEKFRILYKASADAIMILEPPNWGFTAGNPATLKMFGVKSEKEFISLGPWDISPEKQPDGQLSAEKSKQMIMKAVREGSIFFEWTHRRYKGENFPATVLLSRIEEGTKRYLQATVRDITKEKQAVEKLTESERKFKIIFDNSSLGIALVSTQGRWVKVNTAICEMLGYSEKELLVKDFQDITYPDEVARDVGAMKKMLIGEMKNYQVEKRYINKKGEVLWVSLHVNLARDERNQPLYFVSEIEDISERKKIDSRNQILTAIVESSQDAIFSKDLTGIILFWNKGAENLYQYNQKEIVGKKVDILLPEDRKDEFAKILDKIKKGERIEHFDTVRIKKDGNKLSVSLTVSPILNKQGEIIGASSIARDITNQIERTKELEKMNRLMVGRELKMIELKNKIVELEKNK